MHFQTFNLNEHQISWSVKSYLYFQRFRRFLSNDSSQIKYSLAHLRNLCFIFEILAILLQKISVIQKKISNIFFSKKYAKQHTSFGIRLKELFKKYFLFRSFECCFVLAVQERRRLLVRRR